MVSLVQSVSSSALFSGGSGGSASDAPAGTGGVAGASTGAGGAGGAGASGAIAAAYAGGCDGVKIDVRVTKDNVPIIAHSSSIQYYESLDCGGKKIEDMTAAQVTSCHRFPSITETFQRLGDVLNYLRGKARIIVNQSRGVSPP